MLDDTWVKEQVELCRRYGATYFPCDPESIIGISADTSKSKMPINGLRHPPQADTSGWYLWSGNVLSQSDDFFQPLHAKHLHERCPQVVKFLGLPPGFRFLIAEDYEDVWYDESLIRV